tara:strand:+ start:45 stop:1598 length:1554 start_codon:yes stop_codon:yes gene_type:complete
LKFIGQHIVNAIARFRQSVFVENVVNAGADTDTFLVLKNNQIAFRTGSEVLDDIGGGAGDITGVTITTDSGGGSAASDATGSADFSILGSSGVGVTNSGNTITAVAVPGEIDHDSLSNFLASEHYQWSEDISSTATINTNNINDLHGAGVDGSVTQLLTDVGNGTINSEPYFAVRNSSNISALYIKSNEDTGDQCTISTTTHGATTITTTDDDAAAAHFEIAADGDITLDAAGGIVNEADQVNFDSPNANDPLVIIKNTANDATSGRLRFLNQRGSDGVDDDECGIIQFYSYDDGTPSGEEYATIKGTIHDATSGQESGRLQLQVASHDGGTEDGLVLTGGSADAEVDVTIGNGADSVVTIPGQILAVNGGMGTRHYGTTIKILPTDFIQNEDGGVNKSHQLDDTTTFGVRATSTDAELWAFIAIPEGMKATHTHIKGLDSGVDGSSADDFAIEVFEYSLSAGSTTSKGTGVVGTNLNHTDVESSAINCLAIRVDTADITGTNKDVVYGGYVTIAAI